MLFCRLQQKTGLAFTAVAVQAIFTLPFGRMVRAKIKTVDMGVEMSKF